MALVVGALVGARVVAQKAGDQPVAMSPTPAPLADSAECALLVSSLPGKLLGHDQARIAEPVPPGTAAWQTTSTDRVTLRCGVDLPFQYTDIAQTTEVDGVEWLQVNDMTPQSSLTTWYAIDRQPVVAVTTESGNPVDELSSTVKTLPRHLHETYPTPLAELESAANSTCIDLIPALPETLAGQWRKISAAQDTAVWVSEGNEPVVLRCAVAPPPNYAAGKRLTQIDDIPWFEDTQLVNGSTASSWYALGRAIDIAVSVPQSAAAEVLPALGNVIAETTEPQPEP